MTHQTAALLRREIDCEAEFLQAFHTLRGAFYSGIHGDMHEPIPTPGFEPRSMPAWQAVHQMLFAVDADGGLLVDLLRVAVRASEAQDPILCGMAQRVIAQLARQHAALHKEDFHV